MQSLTRQSLGPKTILGSVLALISNWTACKDESQSLNRFNVIDKDLGQSIGFSNIHCKFWWLIQSHVRIHTMGIHATPTGVQIRDGTLINVHTVGKGVASISNLILALAFREISVSNRGFMWEKESPHLLMHHHISIIMWMLLRSQIKKKAVDQCDFFPTLLEMKKK